MYSHQSQNSKVSPDLCWICLHPQSITIWLCCCHLPGLLGSLLNSCFDHCGFEKFEKKSFGVSFSAKLAVFGPVSCTKGLIPMFRIISDHPCLSLRWSTWLSTSDSKSFSQLSQSEKSSVCTLLTLPTSMSDSAYTSRSTVSSASKPKNGSSLSVESKISMAKLLKDWCPPKY